jgi:DNA-binding MarR family transcriptional regulator
VREVAPHNALPVRLSVVTKNNRQGTFYAPRELNLFGVEMKKTSKKKATATKPIDNEQHELYARYISIPLPVLDLLESKTISPREALLLGLIDGYCNHSRRMACFASNRYLARRLGCTESQVKTMLTAFYKLGLVQSKDIKTDAKNEFNRRELVVNWPK